MVRAERALLESRGHAVGMFEADNREIRGVAGAARAAVSATWSRSSRLRMAAELARRRPDVVHVHNFFPLLSPSIYEACREAGVPVVQTLHNYRLVCPNAVFFRDGHPCEDCLGRFLPWPGVVHACYQGSRLGTAPIAGMLAIHRLRRTWSRKVDRFIALTEFARRKFIEGGLPGDRIVVKPNFVDPAPRPGDGAGRFALFIGRFSPEKGIPVMLEAWRRGGLGERLPLRIVGEGALEGELRRIGAGIPGLEWMGARPHAEVLELLGRASCLVLPSVCYEMLNTAMIEAYASGTPVIASGHESMAAVVRHGETGLLFRPGDASDLAARVEDFLAHPESHVRMRVQSRAEFEARYTAEQNHAALMAIYEAAREGGLARHGGTEDGGLKPEV